MESVKGKLVDSCKSSIMQRQRLLYSVFQEAHLGTTKNLELPKKVKILMEITKTIDSIETQMILHQQYENSSVGAL